MTQARVKQISGMWVLLLGVGCISTTLPAAWAGETIKSALSTDVICSYAPSQSTAVSHLAAATGGAAAAATSVAHAAGLTAVLHSSGGIIFTGSGGYIAGTLGTAAALPTIVTIGAVVGGTVATVELICVGKNHPELVKKVGLAAAEFVRRSREIAATTSERTVTRTGTFIAKFKQVTARVRADGFEYANRTSATLGETIKTVK